MALARVSVGVDATMPLRAHPFRTESAEPVASLELGHGSEVGVSGSPAAMRRLAAAVLAAAAAADELSSERERVEVVAPS